MIIGKKSKSYFLLHTKKLFGVFWFQHRVMLKVTIQLERIIFSFATLTSMHRTWLHSFIPSFSSSCARSMQFLREKSLKHSTSRRFVDIFAHLKLFKTSLNIYSILDLRCTQRASYGLHSFLSTLRQEINHIWELVPCLWPLACQLLSVQLVCLHQRWGAVKVSM